MGTIESSILKIDSLEKQQETLMKEHAAMAKRLAEAEEKNKKQEADLENMAKVMYALIASAPTTEQISKTDQKQIDIEGVIYNLTEVINRGPYATIYKGQVQNSNRAVAIKIMKNSPLTKRETENEIRFLRLIKKISINPHPIIDYYGSKITNENIFISLEIAACDLVSLWFQGINDRSPEERFILGIVIIMYTLRALTFLERLNIIHGDINPQNLVLVQTANAFCIKLIDFATVEKMQTLRTLVTVDASKSYTEFFVSPEFLRRDSNNLISRRLHKKSDAWAAGVMFYILFLQRLPWKDGREYENFVNDPRAKDIVVPEAGGYKLIIELLLKKYPEERASAKETLLQVKAHTVLGVIVDGLQEAFCPFDDVCHITIPDDLRKEMANFATPQERADMASGSSTPGHMASTSFSLAHITSATSKSSHTASPSYKPVLTASTSSTHSHTASPSFKPVVTATTSSTLSHMPTTSSTLSHMPTRPSTRTHSQPRQSCRYGPDCYRKTLEHKEEFAHPGDRDYSEVKSNTKLKCRYGTQCYRRGNPEHMAKYSHN